MPCLSVRPPGKHPVADRPRSRTTASPTAGKGSSRKQLFLLCLKFLQRCKLHQKLEGLQCEDLSASGQEQFPHVFTSHTKPTAPDTGDDLKLGLVWGLPVHA